MGWGSETLFIIEFLRGLEANWVHSSLAIGSGSLPTAENLYHSAL